MLIISGVLETALYVKDLETSRAFYQNVLGFSELMREEGRLIGMRAGSAKQVLLLFAEGKSTEGSDTPGGHIPSHDGHGRLHLCFVIAPGSHDEWKSHFATHGVELESAVSVPQEPHRAGGLSLYFRDPDNHLVELATPGIWPGLE